MRACIPVLRYAMLAGGHGVMVRRLRVACPDTPKSRQETAFPCSVLPHADAMTGINICYPTTYWHGLKAGTDIGCAATGMSGWKFIGR
eukprot:3940847-Rhodomonas_salina.4